MNTQTELDKKLKLFNELEDARRTLYFSDIITHTESIKIELKILKYAKSNKLQIKDGWTDEPIDLDEQIKLVKQRL